MLHTLCTNKWKSNYIAITNHSPRKVGYSLLIFLFLRKNMGLDVIKAVFGISYKARLKSFYSVLQRLARKFARRKFRYDTYEKGNSKGAVQSAQMQRDRQSNFQLNYFVLEKFYKCPRILLEHL